MFATDISEISGFALQAGKFAFGLVVILTTQIIAYRINLIFSNKRKDRLKNHWHRFINEAIYGSKINPVKVNSRDIYFILEEINYVFSVIRGEEVEKIRSACSELGLHDHLLKFLKSKNIRKKLYALITLGNMLDHKAWDDIEKSLSHKQTIISLAAARSMVQIDPEKALQYILPLTLVRKDWPWANIAHIFKLAGPARICQPLAELIQTMPVAMQASFLRLFEIVRCEEISPVTQIILEKTDDDKVASVCLHISQDPKILPFARHYSKHQRWHVRMHSASALGRFGGNNEIPLLIELLKDQEWWVRYRSAQALVSMPFLTNDKINNIRETIDDRFARDIVDQVLSEENNAD